MILVFGIFLILSVTFLIYWILSRQFAEGEAVGSVGMRQLAQPNVNIALVGDSWVVGGSLDSFMRLELIRRGWSPKISSFGQSGARSRAIYENLFKEHSVDYSSRSVLFGDSPDVCIVVAGVNDTFGYIGSDFYAHHMVLIVQSLRDRGVFPFILEVPEFGIEEVESRNPFGYLRRRVMRFLYHDGRTDVIAEYRSALDTALAARFSPDEYVIVRFDSVSRDYRIDRHIFEDDLAHLNSDGRKRLASSLSESIDAWLRSKLVN